ncbi:ADP-ribosylglycohydrolase family protein [Ferruginibacter sp.]
MITTNKIKDAILGLVIADAVGVPYEFSSRETLKVRPAKDMISQGSHNQAKGTWSDDSSLTLCLLDALIENYSLQKIAENFIGWKYKNLWTARGRVFDIGITTSHSIERLNKILKRNAINELGELKYMGSEEDNGNGSLMRILPLAFYLYQKPIEEQWQKTWEVSALTHPPFRAAMACLIYNKITEQIIEGKSFDLAYKEMCNDIISFWKKEEFSEEEFKIFGRILSGNIGELKEEVINSGGYVINTLEASIWVLLDSNSYKEAVLKAVNLGRDTDTTAAVVGGIAGLMYGQESFPENWYWDTARITDIENLCERFSTHLNIIK